MKMKFKLAGVIIGTLATLAAPAAALAHPKLVAAMPAANTKTARTKIVKLTFTERLMPKLSTATLIMANHPDMKMTGVTSKVTPDGKSIVLTSAKPLPPGSYRADWVIVGADTHRIKGSHSFSIR
jgi:copper resistance protein C